MKTEKIIRIVLIACVVLLGLTGSAFGCTLADDLLIYYSMDAADSMVGFMMNSATGAASLGPIGMGVERFLAANQGYVPGMLGESVILSNDGRDPNWLGWCGSAWCETYAERGNIIDIPPEVESHPYMNPFENKTISFWFQQTAQIEPSLHHPDFDSVEYLFASSTYSTDIAFLPGDNPGDPDVLGFRAGGSGWVRTVPVNMHEWHHVAMVLANIEGPQQEALASFYLDGQLLHEEVIARPNATWCWPCDSWGLAAIGGYQWDETITTGHCTGALVDDFGIIDFPADDAVIAAIYAAGMQGVILPEVVCPPTPTPTVYHVDGATGSNSNDGLSREAAFETIQWAIDTAQDGDTVLVWPGVYNETATHGINFGNKAITVKSAADAAVLEVPGFSAVTFTNGAGANSVFSNFVVRGSGTGIFVLYANPTISNVTVVDNNNGVIADTANPNITNSIFWNNANGDLFGDPDPITAQYSWVEDEQADPNDPNDPNLIAYWKLDGDATDSAGSNDGTIYGATPTTGQVGDAMSFDGSGDWISVDDSGELDLPTSLTVSLLINLADLGDGGILGKYDNWGEYNYAVWYEGGTLFFQVGNSGPSRYDPSQFETRLSYTAIDNPNQWYHIAGTYDSNKLRLFVDGTEVAQVDESRQLGNEDTPLCIGTVKFNGVSSDAFNETEAYFNGKIDDVHIYDIALSAEEIEQMYEAGLADGPLFADAYAGDYHLLSERGRYWPAHDVWVLDDVTGPCIDGGDPNVNPSNELMPNGGRINMGAYGNTAYASMSEWPIKGDINNDGRFNFMDIAILLDEWLAELPWAKN
jgi:hypothetical protein